MSQKEQAYGVPSVTPTVKASSESATSVAELGVAQLLGDGDVASSGVSERHEEPGSVPRASEDRRECKGQKKRTKSNVM